MFCKGEHDWMLIEVFDDTEIYQCECCPAEAWEKVNEEIVCNTKGA